MQTRTATPTFDALCELEPRLATLREVAAAVRDRCESRAFCANNVWSVTLKPALERLVGWGAQVEGLQSSAAYEVATREIYDCLPPCRGCGCM